jgi:hypothetical protein
MADEEEKALEELVRLKVQLADIVHRVARLYPTV